MSGRKVVGPLIAAGVADDDVLVIGERPDVGFLGRQCFLTEVGRHADLPWVRIPRATVAGSTVDIADDLLDIDRLRPGGNPAVDENAVGRTATSTPTKASGFCRTAAVTMDSAMASASRSGCPGETYSACWFMILEVGLFRAPMV